jgi:hypothetical protein
LGELEQLRCTERQHVDKQAVARSKAEEAAFEASRVATVVLAVKDDDDSAASDGAFGVDNDEVGDKDWRGLRLEPREALLSMRLQRVKQRQQMRLERWQSTTMAKQQQQEKLMRGEL